MIDKKHPVQAAKELYYSQGGTARGWSSMSYSQRYKYIQVFDCLHTVDEKASKVSKKERAYELHAQGFRPAEIAKKLSMSSAYLSSLLRDATKDPAEDKQKILELYHQGMPLTEVADKLGFSWYKVQHHTRGIERQTPIKLKRRPKTQERNKEILGDWYDGMSYSAICAKYELKSEAYVKELIRQLKKAVPDG
jgi:DNA-binding CsgD family transcriptional regulator